MPAPLDCGSHCPMVECVINDHDALSSRIKSLDLEAAAGVAPTITRPNTAEAAARRRRRSSVDSWGTQNGSRRRDSRMPNTQAAWRSQRARDRWHRAINRIVSFARWNRFEIRVRLPAELMQVVQGSRGPKMDRDRSKNRIELREFFRAGKNGIPTSIADILRKTQKEREPTELNSIAVFASTLRALQGMTERSRAELLAVGRFDSYPAGRLVCQQGREPQNVFLVLSGKVAEFSEERLPSVMRTYAAGELFGGCAGSSRPTSTLTVEPTEMLVIPSATYHSISVGAAAEAHVPPLPIFSTMTIPMQQIVETFQRVVFPVDHAILRQGHVCSGDVYLIIEGSVLVTKVFGGTELKIATLQRGQALGIFAQSVREMWAELASGSLEAPITAVTAERSSFLVASREEFAKIIASGETLDYFQHVDMERAIESTVSQQRWMHFKTHAIQY